MLVAGEMRWNPVEQHTNIVLMAIVHKVHEILGRAIAAGGRIIARHLVAPRAVIGILGDAHQFDMGVAQIPHIGYELMRQIAIRHPLTVRRRRHDPGCTS